MTPERIEKSEAMIERYGAAAIFLGRFFPFIRTFAPFLAGCGGMKWHSFAIFNILGGITRSSVFVNYSVLKCRASRRFRSRFTLRRGMSPTARRKQSQPPKH